MFVEHVRRNNLKFTGAFGLLCSSLMPTAILLHHPYTPLLIAHGDGCVTVGDIADRDKSSVHCVKNDIQAM